MQFLEPGMALNRIAVIATAALAQGLYAQRLHKEREERKRGSAEAHA